MTFSPSVTLRQLAEAATPGPWRVAQRNEPTFTRQSVVMDDGEPVALIHHWDERVDSADARLIALAPAVAMWAADAAEWIDTSMHSPDDDLDGGHALLARLGDLVGQEEQA